MPPNTGDFGPAVSVTLDQTGPVVYSNVTENPPTLSSPTTYTTYASFPAAQMRDGRPGSANRPEQAAGLVHTIDGGGGDILIDLRGDTGHVVQYPVWIQNYRSAIIRAVNMLLARQPNTAPGDLMNEGGGTNNYWRAPAGSYCFRIDGREKTFFDGCYVDANVQEADYVIFRNTQGNPAQRNLCELVLRNSIWIRNEGEKSGVHADIVHNQGHREDPIVHPARLVFENSLFFSGMDGMVMHPDRNGGQQCDIKTRRCTFLMVNDYQAPAAAPSGGFAIGQSNGGVSGFVAEDTWYGTWKNNFGGMKIGRDFGSTPGINSVLTDPLMNSGEPLPGLHFGKVGSNISGVRWEYISGPHGLSEFPTFGLEKQFLGPDYVLPPVV